MSRLVYDAFIVLLLFMALWQGCDNRDSMEKQSIMMNQMKRSYDRMTDKYNNLVDKMQRNPFLR